MHIIHKPITAIRVRFKVTACLYLSPGEIRQCHIVPLRHNDLQVSVLYECYVLIWVKVDTVSICHLSSQLFA